MRGARIVFAVSIVVAGVVFNASDAAAQGCILLRQTSPMFGTTGTLDQEVGTWNLTFTGRNSTADIHYNGTERQRQRETEQTYVVNRQNSMTTTISYQADAAGQPQCRHSVRRGVVGHSVAARRRAGDSRERERARHRRHHDAGPCARCSTPRRIARWNVISAAA